MTLYIHLYTSVVNYEIKFSGFFNEVKVTQVHQSNNIGLAMTS